MIVSWERIILIAVWVIAIAAFFFIPKRHRREAQVIFLFQQFLSWILGLIVVQNGWLQYPVRELHENRTSFTFEFMGYPIIAVYMNLYYPVKKSAWVRFLYMMAYPAAITVIEVMIEVHTELIEYMTWTWYWSFLSIWATLYISFLFYRWFFRSEFVK
ncbi:CBO0543 family protein [Paenibacillus sp. N3.4]|uniref:CBO0543 family protein n=1 Tax=Paenibacillus sp. N3.4 TaxID=2603222 RepID=UPI0011CA8B20|nr:CBO0543 family protein [Paenibacillus sp. N3.4]TXK76094.1 hypothetical protein FU659_26220 [Paenibacillus sp. N3.4]